MHITSEIVKIAKRENNKKRKYLVINELQGKHIPVSPKAAFQMFDELANILKAEYRDEALLLVGFAETATAIGARLAVQLDSYYIQTTREQMEDVEYLFFTEAHSHATEQKLVRNDMDDMIRKVKRIIFIEDEVTTGNTILNIINILETIYPVGVHFSVASLLNGMDEKAQKIYTDRQISLHYLIKTDHKNYTDIAESYAADGTYFPVCTKADIPVESYAAYHYLNARRGIRGSSYAKACQTLWEQMKAYILPKHKEEILVIGTEEFMYPALFLGECLENSGCRVKCHSTTRSPIAVSSDETYPLHRRYELTSLYEDTRRTFLYDLESYDRVIVVTDAPNTLEKGAISLNAALYDCGNKRIQWIRWCKK